MYIIQRHTTRNGNLSRQWNLIKEATGEIISRFTSGKMAESCLQELQTLVNFRQNNDSSKQYQEVSVQLRNESLDSQPVSRDVQSLPTISRNCNSSTLSQTTRNSVEPQPNQKQPAESSPLVLHRQKDKELDKQFKSFIQQSFDKSRGFCSSLADANHSLADANHSLADANHSLADANHSLAAVATFAIGLAAGVTGVDVGGLDSRTERTVYQPSRGLAPETIDVTVVA